MTTRSFLDKHSAHARSWYLERIEEGAPRIVSIVRFPFTIGRLESSDLFLDSSLISRRHAEIDINEDGIFVRDFNSTNGTLINNRHLRGAQAAAQVGDILQFGNFSFRLRHDIAQSPSMDARGTTRSGAMFSSASHFVSADLSEAVECTGALEPYFQPIVHARDLRLSGYEWLGCGTLAGLEKSAIRLPKVACGLVRTQECATLSDENEMLAAMWQMSQKHSSPSDLTIFFNVLPEKTAPELLRVVLLELRAITPTVPFVIEINEATALPGKDMADIKALLHSLGMRLAYDRFTTGQPRLLEALTVLPDIIKFDPIWIHALEQHPSTQQLVADLITVARNLGIETLAEGIETRAAVDICIALGFDYLQGFYFGKPEPDFIATTFRPAP